MTRPRRVLDVFRAARRQGFGALATIRLANGIRTTCPYCLDRRMQGPEWFCCGMQEDDYWQRELFSSGKRLTVRR